MEQEKKNKGKGGKNRLMVFSYIIIILSVIATGAIAAMTSVSYSTNLQITAKEEKFLKSKEAITSFISGSDLLTNDIWSFANTKDRTYMEAYWTEVQVTRSRDKAVQTLIRLNISPVEASYIQSAKASSDYLIESETWAMRMICESEGMATSEMPERVASYQLSAADSALTNEQKENNAKQFLFGYDYSTTKFEIRQSINEFDMKLTTRLTKEINETVNYSNRLSFITTIMMVFSILGLVAMLIIYILLRNSSSKRLAVALKEAEAASSAKSYFTSRMSHEIRTPLNAVIGYMSLANSNIKNESKAKEYIEKSDKAAHNLLDIVNDVLDLSAIESGRMQLASASFSIAQLISDISLIYYSQARSHKIFFKNINVGLKDEILIGDRIRTNQILTNFLSNACKFTPEGGQIVLTTVQEKAEGNKVRMTYIVSDNGIGMSEAFQKKLFTPYEQQDTSIGQKYGGTGLGLSIVKKLVELMGGTILCFSSQGKGTTFKVTIEYGIGTQEPLTNTDYSSCRCLVAERGKQYSSTLVSYLTDLKIKTDSSYTHEETVAKINESIQNHQSYNFILGEFPEDKKKIDELANLVKSINKDSRPVVIIDSYDTTEIKEHAEEGAVNYLISRPIFESDLDKLLSSIINGNSKKLAVNENRSSLQGIKVLLCEDNKMNSEIATSILEMNGAEVTLAENGREAVEKFLASKEDYYDVILMDLMMPIMSGNQATEAIRKTNRKDASSVYIIAMTANAFVSDVKQALASGMNSFISKPIDVKKLIEEVSKHKKEKYN
ncbi:MAG: ATP-binding protein [Bacilli bacterium]|jgi:signal transduction histidine kinase/CheY-like chemotaxis protein|nr:ATP-binding protein [Bacilli bacterium]